MEKINLVKVKELVDELLENPLSLNEDGKINADSGLVKLNFIISINKWLLEYKHIEIPAEIFLPEKNKDITDVMVINRKLDGIHDKYECPECENFPDIVITKKQECICFKCKIKWNYE